MSLRTDSASDMHIRGVIRAAADRHRRRTAAFIIFLVAGLFAVVSNAAPPPNILLIVADDLGYSDVGFNGGKTIRTPNLDRLAASGINLKDFRACPMCSPTRAGMLTGRWPIRYGVMRAVIPPWSKHGLPADESTLPELLGQSGYGDRALVGKWHLGHARREFLPLSQGFSRFYGHYNGAIDYFNHRREGEIDWHDDDRTKTEAGYSTDLLAAEAARFIKTADGKRPWLLYLAFNAPHSPFQAKPEDLARYAHVQQPDRRTYAAMVDCMDQGIGRVLAAAESRADSSNTLVLFFSDNGGVQRVGSNAPWRGAKLSVYEGGTRVCAVIRWPAGRLAGGKSFDGRVGYIDVLPSLLGAASIKAPAALDGVDFLPAVRGEAQLPARPWFSYIHQGNDAHASVHEKQMKLVAQGDFFAEMPATPPRLELYDLHADPSEQKDLASTQPDLVTRLHKQLREFGKLQKPGVDAYSEGRAGFRPPKDWVISE